MLSRKNGQLDAQVIRRLTIVIDENGKPTHVIADTANGFEFEVFSAELMALIISSAIPYISKSKDEFFCESPTYDEDNDGGGEPGAPGMRKK